jgi:hypothetical protein
MMMRNPSMIVLAALTAIAACGDDGVLEGDGGGSVAADAASGPPAATTGMDGGASAAAGASSPGATMTTADSAGPSDTSFAFLPLHCEGDWHLLSSEINSGCQVCRQASCCEEINRCGMAVEPFHSEHTGCLANFWCISRCMGDSSADDTETLTDCVRGCQGFVPDEGWRAVEQLVIETYQCIADAPAVAREPGDTGWRLDHGEDAGIEGSEGGCYAQCDRFDIRPVPDDGG